VPFCASARMATAVVLARRSVPERVRLIADSGAVGGTHSTGCRARFCVLCSRGTRPPCLLLLLRRCNNTSRIVEKNRRALATRVAERETRGVEPLPASARTPPRPPKPPAPPTTGWAGQPSWGHGRPVVIRRSSSLNVLREIVSEMRRVIWPNRPTTIFNARVVFTALCTVAVGIAAVNVGSGDAIGSLIH